MEQYKMFLVATDKGEYYRNSFTRIPLKWVSKECDKDGKPLMERLPYEQEKEYDQRTGFIAGGRAYRSVREICKVQFPDSDLCEDIYGRQVLHLSERFPCFDSYDYLNENRYYHWFFIYQEDKLTMVCCEDGSQRIKVTEDIAQIRAHMWKELKKIWKFCYEGSEPEK